MMLLLATLSVLFAANDDFQNALEQIPPKAVICPEPEFTKGLSNNVCWAPADGDSVEYRILVFDLSSSTTPPPPPPPWDPSEWIPDTCHTFNTTYLDIPFINGHKYQYIVHAKYKDQWEVSVSNPVWSIQDNDAPLPVPDVEISSLAKGRIRLKWLSTIDTTSNVDWYKVYRRTDDNPTYSLICSIADTTRGEVSIQYFYEDNIENGLIDGTIYWYRVQPVDTVGNEQVLNAIEVCSPSDAISPVPPYLLPEPEFTGGECNTIYWEDKSQGDALFFQIHFDANDPDFTSPESLATWLPGYLDSVRICDRHDNFTYYYRIRAMDEVGNVGAWSNVVHSKQDRVPPEPVQTLVVNSISSGDIILEWDAVADSTSNVDWYIIYRSTQMNDLIVNSSIRDSIADVSYLKRYLFVERYNDPLSGLENGQTYYYVIVPVDTVGNARLTGNNIDDTQIILSPCGKTPFPLEISEYTKGWEVTICWNDLEPRMDVYKVFCRTACQCDSPFVKESDWISDTCFTFIGLCTDLTQYCFQVKGKKLDPLCESDTSHRVCTILDNTPPMVIGGPSVQSLPGGDIYVNWGNVSITDEGSGVEYIELYRYDTSDKSDTRIVTFNPSVIEYYDRYPDNGIQPCHIYSYYLIAVDGLNWRSEGGERSDPTPSDTGLVFTPVLKSLTKFTKGTHQLIHWEFPGEISCNGEWIYRPYAGAESVLVECSPDADFKPALTRTCGWLPVNSHCSFSDLHDGIRYYYRAQTKDMWIHIAQSDIIVSSTQDASPPDPVANLTVMTRADGSPKAGVVDVKLEWEGTEDALSGLAQYIIVRSIIHHDGTSISESIDSLSHDKTSYWDNNQVNVLMDSLVSYTIQPVDSVGNVRTEGNEGVTVSLIEPPFQIIPESKYSLCWSRAPAVEFYFAEAAADSQILGTWLIGVDSTAAQSGWIQDTCYTFDFTTESKKVYFHVKIKDHSGNESGWSQVVSFPIERKVPLASGWNLVSLPLGPDDLYGDIDTPDDATFFKYGSSGYAETETLDVGKGYWIGVPDNCAFSVTGTTFTTYSVSLKAGWNLIGSVSEPRSLFSIVTDPEGMVNLESLFGYNRGYYRAQELEPGCGYWIFAYGTCEVTVSEDGLSGIKSLGYTWPGVANTKLFVWIGKVNCDNGIEKATVTFGVSRDAGAGYDLEYDFMAPPNSPLPGGLSVFFVNDDMRLWQDIQSTNQSQWTLFIQSRFSVQLTIEMPDIKGDLSFVDDEIDQKLDIKKNEPVILTRGSHRFTISEGPKVPTNFDLAQNYPNPFNPSTDIGYQIADRRDPIHTTLKIYNILGQEVRTLVDEMKQPGYYAITWDGKTNSGEYAASGVYLYRLWAGEFAKTKKMLLLQ